MKKTLIVLLAIAILAAATMAIAGISGTPHDIRTERGVATLEPCALCHTPHQGAYGLYPLWNRSADTNAYTVYTSSSFNMGAANVSLDAGSAPCMVCHNGASSGLINYPGRGSVVNTAYNIGSADLGTWTNVGSDLRNEHPVSFIYAASADSANDNNGFPTSGGGTINGANSMNFPLYWASGTSSGGGTAFSCATCHTVHHTPVATYDTVNQVYFLRTSNAGSGMCAGCHTRKF